MTTAVLVMVSVLLDPITIVTSPTQGVLLPRVVRRTQRGSRRGRKGLGFKVEERLPCVHSVLVRDTMKRLQVSCLAGI